MEPQPKVKNPKGSRRKWIHRIFIAWAIVSTLWLANSFRTQSLPVGILESDPDVWVHDQNDSLSFIPVVSSHDTALVFYCGSGVSAHAYGPLLRPIAQDGFAVFIIKLPLRFAPLESYKQVAIERAIHVVKGHPEFSKWVVSGHSLGAALACKTVLAHPSLFKGMVLLGTTHPKVDDLSFLQIPVAKVYGTEDGVAPLAKVLANKRLLPQTTDWVEVKGANHSQFGHYGHQLMDGKATISRESQQGLAREAIRALLRNVEAKN